MDDFGTYITGVMRPKVGEFQLRTTSRTSYIPKLQPRTGDKPETEKRLQQGGLWLSGPFATWGMSPVSHFFFSLHFSPLFSDDVVKLLFVYPIFRVPLHAVW